MKSLLLAFLLILVAPLAHSQRNGCKVACAHEAKQGSSLCYGGCHFNGKCTEEQEKCANRVRLANEKCEARCDAERRTFLSPQDEDLASQDLACE